MVHDLRALQRGRLRVKNGIEWRALPVDFPPWEAVYTFWERWNTAACRKNFIRRAPGAAARASGPRRRAVGVHRRLPDRQGPNTVPKTTSGYHGGKKISGKSRHLAVDAEGWLLALVVTAASVSDKAGAKLLIIRLFNTFSTLKIMWADNGYDGAPLARYAKAAAAITVEVVKRTAPHSFQVLRPLGHRAHLRLADALPAPGPRLRTPHRPRRSHDLLGHRHHHDQAPRPFRNRNRPSRAGAQNARVPASPSRRCSQHELLYLQALSGRVRWPPTGTRPCSR